MKLELINDDERLLKLESKTIGLKWCPHHDMFEGGCDFEDLKGAKGIDFPFGVHLIAVQTGEMIFPIYDQVKVWKDIDINRTSWIFVSYHIQWKSEKNQEMRNTLIERLAINREKQLIKKMHRHYGIVDIGPDNLDFCSLVNINEDIYEALIRDAKFNKKELL